MSWTSYILMTSVCAIKVFGIYFVFFTDIFNCRFHLLRRSLLHHCFCDIPTNVFLIVRLLFLVSAFFNRWIFYCDVLVDIYFNFLKKIFLLNLQRRRWIDKLNMDGWLNVNFLGTSLFFKHTVDIEEIKTFLTIIDLLEHS